MDFRISTAQFYNNSSGQISSLQGKLYSIQNQISTGKRINVPSDDPIGAAAASVAKDKLTQGEAFKSSVAAARGRIDVSSSKVMGAVDILQRISELTVQARNGANGAEDLRMIGTEMGQLSDELAAIANSQDGQGSFLFSGTRAATTPYTLVNGRYEYQGDYTESFVRTGPVELAQTGWTGFGVFEGFLGGDGLVEGTPLPANTGDSFIGDIRQTIPGAYTGDQFQIDFTTSAAGVTQVAVQNLTTATQVVPPTNYTKDMELTVGGVRVTLKGNPKAGDGFTIDTAPRENLLNITKDLANLLKNTVGTASSSAVSNGLATSSRAVSNGLDNLLSNLAMMGAEASSLDLREETIDSDSLALESERSQYEDLDYAKAISDLTRQQTTLEAAMASFAKISGMSLFSYLR